MKDLKTQQFKQIPLNNTQLISLFKSRMESANAEYSDIARIIVNKIPKSFHYRILNELDKLATRKVNNNV